MSRLKRIANHVSPEVHEDVYKNILDGERTRRRSSSSSFLLARQLIDNLAVTPTSNNLIYISKCIDEGKYKDCGDTSNESKWNKRTIELLREKRLLLAKKKQQN